jgi:hypothetical protein
MTICAAMTICATKPRAGPRLPQDRAVSSRVTDWSHVTVACSTRLASEGRVGGNIELRLAVLALVSPACTDRGACPAGCAAVVGGVRVERARLTILGRVDGCTSTNTFQRSSIEKVVAAGKKRSRDEKEAAVGCRFGLVPLHFALPSSVSANRSSLTFIHF